MTYKYKAVTVTGEYIEGIHEAKSTDEVVSMLKGKDYLPIFVEKVNENQKKSIVLKKSIKKKGIAIFCRQFHAMLNAGISIINCLDILKEQTENKTLKNAIGQAYEDVQKGMTLSETMRGNSSVFPVLLVNMVEAGEVSGNLDVIMDRMAIHYEKEFKIENKVKSAFTYPIILIIVSIAVVIFLLTMVMPTFIGMFDNSGLTLPSPTRHLLNISERISNYWYIYLIMIPLIILGIITYSKTFHGRMFFDKLKIILPGIKKTNVKIITSRFTRTLSTLLSSGIPLIQSMEVVSKVVDNVVIIKGLERGIEDIKKGVNLSSIVEEIGVFPPMVYSMIRVGEESGSLDEILLKTADFYDEEVENSLDKMTTMLEPILILIMAVVIGFIVIAMAMPMFDMVNTIEM